MRKATVNASDDLFSRPPPPPPALARSEDRATAKRAARAVSPRVSALWASILVALCEHPGGLTSHEITDATGIEWGSVTPRMLPMSEAGLVEARGERKPPGRRRDSTVWHITAAGRVWGA